MKSRKKIAFIMTPYFPVPATQGGAVETLVENLIKVNEVVEEFQFTVYCVIDEKAEQIAANYRNTNVIYIDNSGIWSKAKYFLFKCVRKLSKKCLLYLDDYHRAVFKHIESDMPDLVIAEGGSMVYEYELLAKKIGKKRIAVHLHAVFQAPKNVDKIFGNGIAISNYVAKVWEKNSNMKMHVLKNCISESIFSSKKRTAEEICERRRLYGFAESDVIFLYVGRIVEIKGVRELCEAFMQIDCACAKLLIVGGDNFAHSGTSKYYKLIQDYAQKSNGKIRMTGYIPNDEIAIMYHMADVQVVPSIYEEGAGLVVLEGMASSLPLIVTDSGGIAEYTVKDGTYTAERKNIVQNLVNGINYMLDVDRRIEMGEKNLAGVGQYNMNRYYEEFSHIVYRIMVEAK